MQKTKAYMEGYEAFQNGDRWEDCPYNPPEKEEQEWSKGFLDAERLDWTRYTKA